MTGTLGYDFAWHTSKGRGRRDVCHDLPPSTGGEAALTALSVEGQDAITLAHWFCGCQAIYRTIVLSFVRILGKRKICTQISAMEFIADGTDGNLDAAERGGTRMGIND